jgi:hypothetical protein
MWDALLEKYLVTSDLSGDPSGVNLFRYGAVTSLDRAALEMYLDELQAVTVSTLNRPQQMTYWINLYNAFTVRTVLGHYPVNSIRDIDISPGLFSNGPWDAKLLTIQGEKISLNDIEHRILRPIWRDPRIHYAVNCAEMDQMLNDAAVEFINHSRGVSLDDRGKLTLSSIYKWFGVDFGDDLEDILEHIRGYASDELKEKIPTDGKVKVKYKYDWSLNDGEGR